MEVGQTVHGRYAIEREIGQGSFGVVYLARDVASGEPRAIKVLQPWLKNQETLRRRLQREAKYACRLNSRHTVRVFELLDEDQAELAIVMEYLEGHDLNEELGKGPMSVERATSIARQTLEALAEAHELGIIHRDLKPENIFLCAPDAGTASHELLVKVLDFGIAKVTEGSDLSQTAKLTMQGGVVGTPVYMSPEQCRGDELTTSADLYSLGVVLYELVTGRVPFDDENPVKVLMLHNFESVPPLPPEIAEGPLGQVIMRVLAKQPQDRFASAAEMAAALDGIAAPTSAAAVGAREPVRGAAPAARPTEVLPRDTQPTVDYAPGEPTNSPALRPSVGGQGTPRAPHSAPSPAGKEQRGWFGALGAWFGRSQRKP
jgi:serine/threonine-protein kinase